MTTIQTHEESKKMTYDDHERLLDQMSMDDFMEIWMHNKRQ